MSQSPQPDPAYGTEPAPADPAEQPRGGAERSSADGYGQDRDSDRYGVPAQPPARTGTGEGAPVWTIVLLVVSGLITLTGVGFLWAAPAVLAIVALVKNPTDPSGARRLSRIGWVVAGVLAVLTVLLVVVVAVVLFTVGARDGYGPSTVGLDALATLASAARR